MDYVACDLCGHEQSGLLFEAKDTNYGTPGTFPIVRCLNCGLVFQNPRPSPSEIGAFYPTETYHPFKALNTTEAPSPAPLHRKRAAMLSSLCGPGRVLDVGCGSGLFLLAMQELGWLCQGVEPNRDAAEFAAKVLELPVQRGDIFVVEPPLEYDLITLWDVLEHTHSPKNVLLHAKKLLGPGGFLAVSVPNWGSAEQKLFRGRWIAVDAPRHLYHFTTGTLRALLDRCSLEIVMIKTQATPLSLSNNFLRWAGDTFLRRGESKYSTAEIHATANRASLLQPRKFLIQATHLLMKIPHEVINLFNQGSGILLIARKPLLQEISLSSDNP